MWNSSVKLLWHKLLSLTLKMRNFWRASRPSDPLSYRLDDGPKREMRMCINDSRWSFVVVDVPDRLSVNVLLSSIPSPSFILKDMQLTITLIVAGRLVNYLPVTKLMPPSAVPDRIIVIPTTLRRSF